MSCEQLQELMPEACGKCAETLEAMRSTMALLDEWKAPVPSPYFDTRMQALLREEKQKAPEGMIASVMAFFRRPVLGIAAVGLLAFGAAFLTGDHLPKNQQAVAPTQVRGTAVADLQMLDKQSDLLQDFDALDSSPDDDNSSQLN
jgi:hypothetical protein